MLTGVESDILLLLWFDWIADEVTAHAAEDQSARKVLPCRDILDSMCINSTSPRSRGRGPKTATCCPVRLRVPRLRSAEPRATLPS
jgi:hypothetical protein